MIENVWSDYLMSCIHYQFNSCNDCFKHKYVQDVILNPSAKHILIETLRTRSNLRKKPFIYLCTRNGTYRIQYILKLCKQKKEYRLEKPNWDSVRCYAFSAQEDHILLVIIYFIFNLLFLKIFHRRHCYH